MPMMATNCKVFSHSETKFKLGWQEDSEESNKKEKKKRKPEFISLVLYNTTELFNILGSCSWKVIESLSMRKQMCKPSNAYDAAAKPCPRHKYSTS